MASKSDRRATIRDVKDIGAAVRRERKAQGLTQRDLADLVGVGVRFLSEFERGKDTAEIGLVLEVVASLGFDLVLEKRGWSTPSVSAPSSEDS